jgi:hypothetical protein
MADNTAYLSFKNNPDPSRTSLDKVIELVEKIVNRHSENKWGDTHKTSGMTFRRMEMRDGRVRTDIMKRVYVKRHDRMGVKPVLSCVSDSRNGTRKVADYKEEWITRHIQWIEEIADHGSLRI